MYVGVTRAGSADSRLKVQDSALGVQNFMLVGVQDSTRECILRTGSADSAQGMQIPHWECNAPQ